MTVHEVIRRNRLRLVVVAMAATVNFAVVATLLVWALFRGPDLGSPLFWVAIAIGIVVAVGYVVYGVRTIRPRTLAGLGAVELAPGELPVVDHLLAEVSLAVGVSPPTAALLADAAPNAMAVGHRRRDTTIVVTTGLIEAMTRDELEAVLAAELWSIRRLDTALQSVVASCTGGAIEAHLMFREDKGCIDPRAWIWIVLTWPTMAIAEVLRRSVLRNCDFGADEMAVATTRHPDALVRAIVKLRDDQSVVRGRRTRGTEDLWFEPLPHSDRITRAREFRGFSMTPSLDERLARLRATSGGP